MSIGTLESTMRRIKAARPLSPISVFIFEKMIDNKTVRQLDAVFTNTAETVRRKQALLDSNQLTDGQVHHEYEWIGDFHYLIQQKATRALLAVALEK